MSLTLTNVVINRELKTVRTEYEVQCQDTENRKTLIETAGFTFDHITGAVTAELVVVGLAPQESFEEARLHLAHWLEQLAKELKKTPNEVAHIPIFR